MRHGNVYVELDEPHISDSYAATNRLLTRSDAQRPLNRLGERTGPTRPEAPHVEKRIIDGHAAPHSTLRRTDVLPDRPLDSGARDGVTVIDSRRALLVWEPGKRVPIYAFCAEDVRVNS